MPVGTLISAAYRRWSRRRPALLGVCLATVLLGFVGLSTVEVREDVEALLPDRGSDVAADFRLLQKAPFARKVLVNLSSGGDREALLAGADRLAAAMGPPYFSAAASGPAAARQSGLLPWLTEALPNLATAQDLAALEGRLDPEALEGGLQRGYARLLSPEGMLVKKLLRRDPLETRTLALEKLRFLNPVEKARLEGGSFLSADGDNALVVAETPVPITDFGTSRQLLDRFEELAEKALPGGVRAELISGHRYTVANAEAIQGDLALVLGVSGLSIAALFLLFLRSWRALFVFAVPVSVLGLAAMATALVYPAVSGVTIGFGAVLLGITVDFALHVYFALRHGGPDRAAVLERVSRPLLFGGLTTLGAFAVLLLSDLPGQRQLAVFSLAGIAAALLLSLFALPHLVGSAGEEGVRRTLRLPSPGRRGRRAIVAVWVVLLALGAWQGTRLHFDGSLRSLGSVPADLRAAEDGLRNAWGDLRGQAMLFAEGNDLEGALQVNDRLFAGLLRDFPDARIVSLAPLLPSEATQEANRRGWVDFWSGRREPLRAGLDRAGAPLGFSPRAFDPFFAALEEAPPPVTPGDLRAAGLGELLDAMLLEGEGVVRLLTLVPDDPELTARFAGGGQLPEGVRLVSQSRFGDAVGTAVGRDFLRFIVLACLVVTALLALLFR
ncbi:MAG: transporter, partial [Desulfuromonas sp.]|uniref:MMPL family transporter n=1 Tax=Desulfuromonas sp. TaxID=892 RepID=UPI000CC88A23